MRSPLTLAVLCLCSAPGIVAAKNPIEIPSDLRAYLLVYRNARGRYLVLPNHRLKADTKQKKALHYLVFYGDAKQLYRQRRRSYSSVHSDGSFSVVMRDPRMLVSRFDYRVDSAQMHCDKAKVPLKEVGAAQARALLDKAVLRPYFWAHEPHLLARDDEGVYYYVDRARIDAIDPTRVRPDQLRGFRLWIGRRGRVKPVGLRDAVIDEAGQIFLTKQGALHVDRKRAVSWRRGKQRTPLVDVSIDKTTTRLLIHKHLGAYSNVRFHTPCDDL